MRHQFEELGAAARVSDDELINQKVPVVLEAIGELKTCFEQYIKTHNPT
ncbi:MAG: hypothetical protein HON94_01890 [Methylococcales bacterium]|nr:hypothetical protein [Methylococcales bacterium]MBT7409814.1 hypothetical protein [Methylococcales bacterium]